MEKTKYLGFVIPHSSQEVGRRCLFGSALFARLLRNFREDQKSQPHPLVVPGRDIRQLLRVECRLARYAGRLHRLLAVYQDFTQPERGDAVDAGWDDSLHPSCLKGRDEFITVISLVRCQCLGTFRGELQQGLRLPDVTGLSASQDEVQRVSRSIGDRVNFGAESAA